MIPQNQKDFLINRIVDQLTEYVVQEYRTDLSVALKLVYESKVYQWLTDSDGYLHSQSPSYVYELLKSEIMNELKTIHFELTVNGHH